MSRSEEFYSGLKAHRFYGKNDIDAMFPEGALMRPVPWEQASHRIDRGDYDRPAVRRFANREPRLGDFHVFDPRDLRATQPNVLRQHVQHYLSGEYRRRGITSADIDNPGNKHPIIYVREGLEGRPSENLILSGHHRAAAALLQGGQFRARMLEGPWGPMRGEGPVNLQR